MPKLVDEIRALRHVPRKSRTHAAAQVQLGSRASKHAALAWLIHVKRLPALGGFARGGTWQGEAGARGGRRSRASSPITRRPPPGQRTWPPPPRSETRPMHSHQYPGRDGQWAELVYNAGGGAVRLVPFSAAAVFPRFLRSPALLALRVLLPLLLIQLDRFHHGLSGMAELRDVSR